MKKISVTRSTLFVCLLLVIGLSALTCPTFGASYYVSTTGNDDASGTSSETAWRSITKVNSRSFSPGDSILFKKGGTWREQLRVSSSGTEGNHITYGAYGEGDRPEILGSAAVSNWTNVSGNIWVSVVPNSLDNPRTEGYDPAEIFFEMSDGNVVWGVYQTYDSSFSELQQEYDWTWSGGLIYVWAPSNPVSRYSEVEVPQLTRTILLLDHDYVTITGLAVKYVIDSGISDNYSTPRELHGLHVTHCEVAYIGRKDGAAAYGLNVHHSDSYYAYNEIHNCGRRGISLTMYQTESSIQRNVVIEHNHLHHGWHTTGLDCNSAGPHIIENIVFRNNLVEGDPAIVLGGVNSNSNHVFIANQSGGSGTIRDFYFYNNIFTWASGSSIKSESVSRVYVHHNTFFNFNPSLANWQAHVYTSGITAEYVVVNNIFHDNAADNRWTAIKVDAGDTGHMTVDRNLYYQSGEGKRFWWVNGGASYYDYQWDAYKAATGNDRNSPAPSNPLFTDPDADFSLQEGSPARHQGITVGWINSGYAGKPMNSPPDLGALQYQAAIEGDIDGNGNVTLEDAILGLRIMTGDQTQGVITGSDVNGDSFVGLAEVLFVLSSLAD